MASYVVNESAVERARLLIRGRQYVLNSDWETSSQTGSKRTRS